jgi:hypothetical protein
LTDGVRRERLDQPTGVEVETPGRARLPRGAAPDVLRLRVRRADDPLTERDGMLATSSAVPDDSAARRHPATTGRRRVVRTERLQTRALTPAQRRDLGDRLYDVYLDTVRGYSREQFESELFGADDVSLALFYGDGGVLAGFSYASIDRVAHDGRDHAVFCAAVFFRLAYRGGTASALFGLGEALRFKLREPRTPLAYLTRGCSPASYRLLASTMPRTYPSRSNATPPEVEALVRALGTRRRYVHRGENLWIVQSCATPQDPARLRALAKDPDAQFYVGLDPRFAEGDALLVWMPLDVANIVGGLLQLALARLWQ